VLLDEIDVPLLILFASLFVVNDAFGRTGLTEEALQALSSHGLLPDRVSLLTPLSLLLSNTIGNVPAVVMILHSRWRARRKRSLATRRPPRTTPSTPCCTYAYRVLGLPHALLRFDTNTLYGLNRHNKG
jgi:hypothetical protein